MGRQAGNKQTDRWFSSFPVGSEREKRGQWSEHIAGQGTAAGGEGL